ncbi:MAG: hypothetical protein ACI843_002652 [Psychrobacter glaciei]|jgi:hypothetical protein
MKDHRQFARKSVNTNVSVFNETDAKFLGVLVDYSETGIMISSYQPLTADTTYCFTIVDLPNNIGRKRTGHIKVKSVWSEQINNTLFGTGFELIDADEEAYAMFRSYDERLQLQQQQESNNS